MLTDEMRADGLLMKLAFALSSRRVKEAVNSIKNGEWEKQVDGHFARLKPYPMGYYPGDPNLYYAFGWGHHEYMWPFERWLLRKSFEAIPEPRP